MSKEFDRKRKSILFRIATKVALASLLCVMVPTAMAEEWEWGLKSEKQISLCDEYLAPVFELYRVEGIKPALDLLDKTFAQLEKNSGSTSTIRTAVWWQAQTQSGEQDEEWGLALFSYLWERKFGGQAEEADIFSPWDILLCANIISKNYALGRANQAREVTMWLEDQIRRKKSFDTTCQSYADLGPIFSFLPQARIRDVPIYESDLPKAVRDSHLPTKKDYILYTYPEALSSLADSARLTGDWVKAAELYSWVISYADQYTQQSNPRRVEIIRFARRSYKDLADIAILHGHAEEAARLMNDYLEKCENSYRTGQVNYYGAAIKLAEIRRLLGTVTEADLETARTAEEVFHSQRVYNRTDALNTTLTRIQIEHALGESSKAWNDMAKFLEETSQDSNPYHQIRGFKAAIDMDLADGGTHPSLEEWLLRALEYERNMGNKFNELPLYERYAQFLILRKHYPKAELILTEAVRLSDAMLLPERSQKNRATLAELVSGRPEQPSSREATSLQPELSLQPSKSVSVIMPGQTAIGRFYLINPTAKPASGTLQISGHIDELDWLEDDWLEVSSQPDLDSVTRDQKLTLPPNSSYVINTQAESALDGSERQITYSWESSDGLRLSSQWKYQTGTVESRSAVIDAHTVRSNPFYLIPIHHTVQRGDTNAAEITDFSAQSSAPTRIEFYSSNGELLAIDSTGNGSFRDKGDMISNDKNRDSWPDFTFKKDQSTTSLILYVTPQDEKSGDFEISVKILRDGEWQTDATDVIKTSRGG